MDETVRLIPMFAHVDTPNGEAPLSNKPGGSLKEDYPIIENRLENSDVPGQEKHQRNIEIVYGLLAGSKQKDAAKLFNISAERVRQIWIITSLRQYQRLNKEVRDAILEGEEP